MIIARHFYMIRHGETEANAARKMAGSIDSPLTAKGIAQAREVAGIVRQLERKPKTIIHSHLSRARDTATYINEFLNVDMHEDPDFAELHAGDWEGASYDDCHDLLFSWAEPPNGETFAQFFERLKRGKNVHLQKHDNPVLIVCHGGVFRAFGKMYGLNMLGVKNCQLFEFEPDTTASPFPWRAWQYALNEDGQIERQKAAVYHDAEVDSIAS